MRLLFYQNAQASDAQLHLLNSVSRSVRTEFSRLIDQMGETHASNVDWWVSELAARNIFATPLFTRLCQLAAVRQLLQQGVTPSEIVVDSLALYRVLKRAKLNVRFRFSPRLTARFLAKPLYNFVSSAGMFALRYLASRRTVFPQKATLIHTFIHSSMFQSNSYLDRYFGDMLSYLDNGDRENCFYVPVPVRTWNYFRLFRLVRKAKQNFLLREDFLELSDYAFALLFPFRYFLLETRARSFAGFIIDELIDATKWYSLASPSSLEGILAFRFARRIKVHRDRIRLVVDWFENQAMNHGMNAGIRWFMPSVPIKGYQGFLNPDMMVSTFPTEFELQSQVVPPRIVVIGSGWVREKKDFSPSLHVEVAPAYRYQHVLKNLVREPLPNGNFILVALPIQVDESVVILTLLRKALARLDRKPIVVVKPHPYLALERIKGHLSEYELVSGDFNTWLQKASVLVSSCSSVCLEAVLCGVPALIVRGPDGMAYSPIPSGVPSSLWRICLDDVALAVALKHFSDQSLDVPDLTELKRSYFASCSSEATKRFLEFNA